MKPTSKTLALASFLWLVALPVAGSAPASAENAQQKKINLGRM